MTDLGKVREIPQRSPGDRAEYMLTVLQTTPPTPGQTADTYWRTVVVPLVSAAKDVLQSIGEEVTRQP